MWPREYSLTDCKWRYSRVAWRIIEGQAALVAYHIDAGPDGRVPQVPDVPKRGEFGTEIITALAWQHCIAGLPVGVPAWISWSMLSVTARAIDLPTVITSVLDSLRWQLPKLTLKAAQEELQRWQQDGISCFRRLVKSLQLPALSLSEKIQSPLELLVTVSNTG